MRAQVERKRQLIEAVVARVGESLPPGDHHLAAPFVERCLGGAALEDLRSTGVDGLAALVRSLLDWARERRHDGPELRISNPRSEEDGPSPGDRTVIEILTDDMPFLVDSVTGALERRGLTVHLALHPQLTARRDDGGRLLELVERGADGEGVRGESLMHLEVDRVTSPPALVALETGLLQVLDDVRRAVTDWLPMRSQATEARRELQRLSPDAAEPAEVAEAIAFLDWVVDDHFTFLGYRDHRLEEGDGGPQLRPIPDSGLGLLRGLPLGERVQGQRPLEASARQFVESGRLVSITKTTRQSTVHRNVHMDLIAVKRFAEDGRLLGEHRFLGLFTSMAYSIAASKIPLVRRKVARVIARTDLPPQSHDAKALRHIVEHYPRDELFQISEDDLYRFSLRILELQLRPRLALLVRRDEEGRYVSCMVYVPRDRHNTDLRIRIQEVLEQAFGGEVTAFSTRISDRPLAQVHFILTLSPGASPEPDEDAVEERLQEVATSWSDRLQEPLAALYGREEGLRSWRRYRDAFPASYQERFPPEVAADDVGIVERVLASSRLGMKLYRREGAAISRLHFRTFELAVPAPLSSMLPMLENMGLRVNTEIPFEVRPAGAPNPVWVRDFELLVEDFEVDPESLKEKFEDAFARVWTGEVENDGFNRLVLRAGLDWRQVVVLRACCKYLRQTGIAFSQDSMEEALAGHPEVAKLLIELFEAHLDPGRDGEDREEAGRRLRGEISRRLEAVESLDHDRILRRFRNLIHHVLRTNHYQRGDGGRPKEYLAFKLDARKLTGLPAPRPEYEIFVYSPRVEAVHLRGGKVARGGIRWSDRREDFRTEILGLIKSQMVKNAVIVPVGAKGGFVVKRPPPGGGREELQAEGVACYRTMIRGLLDVTDNLDGERVVPPPAVVRRDGDDPYLVVAADKGTATFSDVANHVAAEYGFWLGDAFASGGSHGYDHKKMGITARGAWESVKRHFWEMERDVQSQPFTAVGVGDMSGDVFGNGMLLSETTRLVAAFNHLHVFVDPDPDPAASYRERRRLFELERSSWSDYDPAALSEGGGVFDRRAKEVTVSPQVRSLLGLERATVAPAELVRAVLRAPVDLLWFGGIGTFVKADGETDQEVGDHANDELRVTAGELRCKVIGEGANLGVTQAGRIRFALAGGRINTDFIDNSGGVDCSDHEVNIKIALAEATEGGELDPGGRDQLLLEMTDEVAGLVLRDNYLQSLAITVTASQKAAVLEEQARLMRSFERAGLLDRKLEGLPDETTLAERRERKLGLTRPEIAVLLAYSKIYVFNELLESHLPDDVLLREDLVRYFPLPMQWRFRNALERHRLRREIIATHVTNSMINRVGPAFVVRLAEETGAKVSDIARAYAAVREIFALRSLWEEIEELDGRVPSALQVEMLLSGVRMIERATRWFLRHAGRPLDVTSCVARYESDIIIVAAQIEDLLPRRARARMERRERRLRAAGVPESLAARVASSEVSPAACDVARCARVTGVPVERVGQVYFSLGEDLGFDRLRDAAAKLQITSPWQQEAVTATVDDLASHQAELTRGVVLRPGGADTAISGWSRDQTLTLKRLTEILQDFEAAPRIDLPMLTVAEHELRRLVELSDPEASRRLAGEPVEEE